MGKDQERYPSAFYSSYSSRDKTWIKDEKKEKIFGLKPWCFELLFFAVAFLFLFLSYCVVKSVNFSYTPKNGAIARVYGSILLAGILVAFFGLLFKHKLTYPKLFFFIFLAGFVLRLTYMLYTDVHVRQYDTFPSTGDGHYAYALSFYETGKLPNYHIRADNIYQFYHPPLNAFIQGVFMHLFEGINVFSNLESDTEILYGSCMILASFYMCLTSYFFIKTVLLFPFSNKAKTYSVLFLSLYPRLIQLSGQLNNDGLSILFSSIALYFFFLWFDKKKSYLNISLSALFVGLALMSKMSASTICLGMAFGFLYELIKVIRKKEDSITLKNLIFQYVVFLVIAAPIGLWWQFYAHYVYGLPFNFVFSNLRATLFTGSRDWVLRNRSSYIDRFDDVNSGILYTSTAFNIFARYILPVYFPDLFGSNGAFCNSFANYNILLYALRSSIYGEFFFKGVFLQLIAVFTNIFIYVAYFSLWVSGIYMRIKKIRFGDEGLWMAFSFLGSALMFLYLQISMPYGCSMDFRYIVPVLVPVSYFLSYSIDHLESKKKEGFGRGLNLTLQVSTVGFIVLSSFFYLAAI